jgi:phosphoribosylanthranilate isomerase
MLSLPLLAHGITHLTDARYFAAWHPDYLCFPAGEQGLSLDYFVAIREWVEGPVCVVELGADAGAIPVSELAANSVTHLLLDYGIDTTAFSEQGIAIITRLPVAGYQSALDVSDRLAELSGPVLLDFTDGGITWSDLVQGHPFSVGMLKEMIGERAVYVSIDLTPDEANEAREAIYGLAVRGSGEEKVGYKSFDDLDPLLEAFE